MSESVRDAFALVRSFKDQHAVVDVTQAMDTDEIRDVARVLVGLVVSAKTIATDIPLGPWLDQVEKQWLDT